MMKGVGDMDRRDVEGVGKIETGESWLMKGGKIGV